MNKIFLPIIFSLLLLSSTAIAQPANLPSMQSDDKVSENYIERAVPEIRFEISLLTCTSGEDVSSIFGHSALKVRDLISEVDYVFNFGMFDFSTPNFSSKFIGGELDYYLGTQSLSNFIMLYDYEEREVYEQKLNLPSDVIDEIAIELARLNQPENRAYRYKFIEHNCTTAIRDLILPHFTADNPNLTASITETSRDCLNQVLQNSPWNRVGINILLGAKIDREITLQESLFLPDRLKEGLENIVTPSGEALVLSTEKINSVTSELKNPSFLQTHYPALIFLLLSLIIILLKSTLLDSIYLFLIATIGFTLLFVRIWGGHMELEANYNILWCNPLLSLLAIGILAKQKRLTKIVSSIIVFCIMVMVVIWATGYQAFEPSFIIVAASILYLSIKYGFRDTLQKSRPIRQAYNF